MSDRSLRFMAIENVSKMMFLEGSIVERRHNLDGHELPKSFAIFKMSSKYELSHFSNKVTGERRKVNRDLRR